MKIRVLFEIVFDLIYLIGVIILGILMIRDSRGNKQFRLFGIMAVTLGAGDAFHLVPRIYALSTTGLENFAVPLGIGKLITSVTMTVFYVLLYYVWRLRYGISGKSGLTAAIWILATVRIILCFCPRNQWLNPDPSLLWRILRNIPFTLMGLLLIILFENSVRQNQDRAFRFTGLTIVLSFAFYLIVVLFESQYPQIGLLMIPKTCAYIWTVLIGYSDMKRSQKNEKIY